MESPFYKLVSRKEQQVSNGHIVVPLEYSVPMGRCCGGHYKPQIQAFTIPVSTNLSISDYLPFTLNADNTHFLGVDRSLDAVRLAGVRYDASDLSVLEELLNFDALLNREGANPDLFLIPVKQFLELEDDLGAKAFYEDTLRGIRYLIIDSPYSAEIKILPDLSLRDDGLGYAIDLNTWNYDKVLTCNAPGFNGVIKFKHQQKCSYRRKI